MAKEQPLFGLPPRSLRPDQATATGREARELSLNQGTELPVLGAIGIQH